MHFSGWEALPPSPRGRHLAGKPAASGIVFEPALDQRATSGLRAGQKQRVRVGHQGLRHRILDQAPPAPYRISPLAISGPCCRGCGSRLRWQRWVEDIFETLGIGHPAVPRLGPGTAVAGGAAAMPSFNSSTNCQFNQQWKCYQSRKFSALLQFRKWLANLTIATPEIGASPINRSAKYPTGMGSTQNLCCK